MEFELHFHYEGEERRFSIEEGEVVIGRKEVCDLCLVTGGVSKRHARILRTGNTVELYDAGSRNGTLVNGEAIDHCVLRPGDIIQIGTVALSVREQEARRSSEGYFSREPGGFDDEQGKAKDAGDSPAADDLDDLIADEEERVMPGAPGGLLKVFDGGKSSDHECVPGRVVGIGSKDDNVVVLQSDGASRYHAELQCDGEAWILKDLGSRNGVFIKSATAKEAVKVEQHKLANNDEIQIGTSRMRFEYRRARVSSSAPLLSHPYVRPALAGLIVLLLLIILLPSGPSGGPSARSRLPYQESLQSGVQLLQNKSWSEAGALFERLAKDYRDQKAPDLFKIVVKNWPDQNNPATFDWEGAYQVARELQKESDRLPKYARLWVDTETERLAINRDAFNYLRDGQQTYAEANQAERQRRLTTAIRGYEQALQMFESISPKSDFFKSAEDQRKAIRASLYTLHMAEGDRFFNSGNTEWSQAMGCYEKAQSYTQEAMQLGQLRRKMNECIQNYEDDARYQEAVEIVRAKPKRWRQYPKALELLESVKSTSSISLNAKAWGTWIRCDLKVRQANLAYDSGESERCLRLLDEVLQVESIGPDARRGVSQKRSKRRRVINSYNEGRKSYLQGSRGYDRAKSLLKIVTNDEKNKENYYTKRAIKMLSAIRVATRGSDLNLLKQGVKSLKKENIAQALIHFDKLRKSATAPKSYLSKLSSIVEREASTRGWFRVAYWDVLLPRDLSRYSWAHDVFYLLKEYLPKRNKTRKDAAKYYKQIDNEIKLLGDQARGRRP